MNKKRRQHYVFQAYLASWVTDEYLWCYRDGKLFNTQPIKVAQERDFYRIEPLNDYEREFLLFFYKKSHPDVLKAISEHIDAYLMPLKWEKALEKFECLIKKNFPQDSQLFVEIENELSILKQNVDIYINDTMEDYYNDIEGDIMKFIKALKGGDSSFYSSPDEAFSFLYSVSVQYFRTKAIKKRWISNFELTLNSKQWDRLGFPRDRICLEHLHPLLMWEFQNLCAYNLIKTNAHLTILINNTDIPFITSDQPVINLKADYTNLENITDELVFYYPLSPKVAITINDSNTDEKILLSEDDVKNYNSSMVNASYEYLFSSNREILSQLISISE